MRLYATLGWPVAPFDELSDTLPHFTVDPGARLPARLRRSLQEGLLPRVQTETLLRGEELPKDIQKPPALPGT